MLPHKMTKHKLSFAVRNHLTNVSLNKKKLRSQLLIFQPECKAVRSKAPTLQPASSLGPGTSWLQGGARTCVPPHRRPTVCDTEDTYRMKCRRRRCGTHTLGILLSKPQASAVIAPRIPSVV